MPTREAIDAWIEAYQAAARSDDLEQIKALFTEDALYFDGPFGEPWRGHNEIVRNWVDQSDKPYEVDFSYNLVAVDGPLGVAEIEYRYVAPEARTYRNVWLIELDPKGRAQTLQGLLGRRSADQERLTRPRPDLNWRPSP